MKALMQNDYGSPDVLALKEIDKPVLSTYPFDEIPAALGYAAGGHARGKVVIACQPT